MGIKSTYETPEVSLVELRPSEAVLVNCKHTGSLGPGMAIEGLQDDCRYDSMPACSTQGS